MIATNPITIDGQIFDRYSLSLAITGKYNGDGTPGACINLLLTPTRIDDSGDVITATDADTSILRGSLSEVTDPAEQTAIAAIQQALQIYIQSKGL